MIFPAIAAFLYAAGQLDLKKALNAGAAQNRVTANSNTALILWSLPLAFILPGQWNSSGILAAILAGAFLFTGRIFMIKALYYGDLSLVAPLLATKTILVGLISLLTGSGAVTRSILVAALLTSVGVALLGHGPRHQARLRWKSLGLAALASIFFALTDVTVQSYAKRLGPGWFLPTMFGTVFLLSPLLGHRAATPPPAKTPLLRGSAIMGFQTSLVIFIISITGQATLVNIIYSTRSLWSVLVDAFTGRSEVKAELGWRLSGAIILTLAVMIVLWK